MTGPKSPQSQAVASVPETRRRRRITAFFRLSLILDTDWTWPEISATIIITSIPPMRLLCWSLKMMLTRPVCRYHVELCFCVCMRSYPTIWNSAVWKCEAVRRSVAPVGGGGGWLVPLLCHMCLTRLVTWTHRPLKTSTRIHTQRHIHYILSGNKHQSIRFSSQFYLYWLIFLRRHRYYEFSCIYILIATNNS